MRATLIFLIASSTQARDHKGGRRGHQQRGGYGEMKFLFDDKCGGFVCDNMGDGPCHCDPCKGCTEETILAEKKMIAEREEGMANTTRWMKHEHNRTHDHNRTHPIPCVNRSRPMPLATEVEAACKTDRVKLCPSSNPFTTIRCIHEHRMNLSDSCKAVLPHGGPEQKHPGVMGGMMDGMKGMGGMRHGGKGGMRHGGKGGMRHGGKGGMRHGGKGGMMGGMMGGMKGMGGMKHGGKGGMMGSKMHEMMNKKHEEMTAEHEKKMVEMKADMLTKETEMNDNCKNDIAVNCPAGTSANAFAVMHCLHNWTVQSVLSETCKKSLPHMGMGMGMGMREGWMHHEGFRHGPCHKMKNGTHPHKGGLRPKHREGEHMKHDMGPFGHGPPRDEHEHIKHGMHHDMKEEGRGMGWGMGWDMEEERFEEHMKFLTNDQCGGSVCDDLGDGPCHCDPCKACTDEMIKDEKELVAEHEQIKKENDEIFGKTYSNGNGALKELDHIHEGRGKRGIHKALYGLAAIPVLALMAWFALRKKSNAICATNANTNTNHITVKARAMEPHEFVKPVKPVFAAIDLAPHAGMNVPVAVTVTGTLVTMDQLEKSLEK